MIFVIKMISHLFDYIVYVKLNGLKMSFGIGVSIQCFVFAHFIVTSNVLTMTNENH